MKFLIAIVAIFAVAVSAETEVRPIIERLLMFPDRYPMHAQLHQTAVRQGRIVGGQIASPGQFPHQVALFLGTAQGTFFCGGSIVNARKVLTAAHCVDDLISVEVILGAHNHRESEPSQIRITVPAARVDQHEEWISAKIQNDLAVIDLGRDITFTDRIRPLPLLPKSAAREDFAGLEATTSGWGRYDGSTGISDVLRHVSANVMTNTACSSYFNILPNNICASGSGGKSSCNGDSGGPMTVQWNGQKIQVGVVSFGSAFGCTIGFPHVYARVSEFIPWLEGKGVPHPN